MKTIIRSLALCAFLISVYTMDANTNRSPSSEQNNTASLVLGGGCFWCVEALYERLDGVQSVISGYAGGSVPNPSYKAVCSGTTGHAEVVKIEFDPAVISLRSLIDFFWEAHDPTTLNRQGADVGTQYRSVILYADKDQEQAARDSLDAARARFEQPIVTQIAPLENFYPAEVDHQDYYRNNPNAPYCRFVIAPKLKKLES